MARTDTAVRKSVTVDVPIERAFDVFTEGIDKWWIRGHHIGVADLERVVIEPRQGGRWYELGTDGNECDWGRVLAWEPPTRVVLSWQLNSEWHYDREFVTELEVRFESLGPDRTSVQLEHRGLENYGSELGKVREQFESPLGWQGLLDAYAGAV
jgi:uncharacterized protein YndB with AHSA1/START domain